MIRLKLNIVEHNIEVVQSCHETRILDKVLEDIHSSLKILLQDIVDESLHWRHRWHPLEETLNFF